MNSLRNLAWNTLQVYPSNIVHIFINISKIRVMEEGYPVKQEKGRKISKIVNNTVENSYFDKFKIMSLKYFCNGIFMKKIWFMMGT